MARFLVCSAHTGREPPDCFLIEALSAGEIVQRYPVFAAQPVYQLPGERPPWLDDNLLAFTESHKSYRLGDTEPTSLATLVEHHANGDVWEWYALEERPSGEEPIPLGELGTFRRFKVGSDIGALPRKPGRWHVVAIQPPSDSRVAARLVIQSARETP
jgi:hypothetical protein